jgi:hypothetical protein
MARNQLGPSMLFISFPRPTGPLVGWNAVDPLSVIEAGSPACSTSMRSFLLI